MSANWGFGRANREGTIQFHGYDTQTNCIFTPQTTRYKRTDVTDKQTDIQQFTYPGFRNGYNSLNWKTR